MTDEKYPPAYIIQGRFNQQNTHTEPEGQLAQILDMAPLLKQREDEERRKIYTNISKLADHIPTK
jgi:hypothetical protein